MDGIAPFHGQSTHDHGLDLFCEERRRCEEERQNAERFLSSITNISIDGADLILDRVFDNVGFNRIEDELRKTGFSEEGRHKNPQIILGLLVSPGGYPLAYCIHEDNKYEAHICICFVALKVCKELERLLKRHQRIAPLFSDDFWGTH